VLSGLQRLTRLELQNARLAPAALAYVSQLQHLELEDTAWVPEDAATYAALTASRVVQRLDMVGASLPPGVWQHTFAAGRQRTALEQLELAGANREIHLETLQPWPICTALGCWSCRCQTLQQVLSSSRCHAWCA
jgi:hypothetical protein